MHPDLSVVIYGEDGESAKMFRNMAKLPVQVLPLGGAQSLQPVHIDDISEAVANWLADNNAESQTIAAVGAEATTMRGMLDSYREQLHHQPAWHIALPRFITKLIAKVRDHIPSSPMCSDTYAMMAAGNTAPTTEFARLLGFEPKSYRTFIPNSGE